MLQSLKVDYGKPNCTPIQLCSTNPRRDTIHIQSSYVLTIYHAFNTLETHIVLFQIMVAFLSYISNACHSLSRVAERLQHTHARMHAHARTHIHGWTHTCICIDTCQHTHTHFYVHSQHSYRATCRA